VKRPIGQAVKQSVDVRVARADRPTLMNAAPARSMDDTRKPYHHSVPLLSLSLSVRLCPSHIAGIVTMTGTKMKTRCRKRSPVAMGSIM
jgi:hypothetical protein